MNERAVEVPMGLPEDISVSMNCQFIVYIVCSAVVTFNRIFKKANYGTQNNGTEQGPDRYVIFGAAANTNIK